jgi:chemotaxis protein MotB
VARKKRPPEQEEHANHERWLVSYADMVTLLMCVFIVLFAMATVDASKFAALKDSLNGGSPDNSVLDGSQSVIQGGQIAKLEDTEALPEPDFELPPRLQSFDVKAAQKALEEKQAQTATDIEEKNNLLMVQQEIQAALDAEGMGDRVKFTLDRRGLVITVVTDQVLFEPGRANIRPIGSGVLDAIGKPLSRIPNDLQVEGHTDNRPINTAQFPTNWELSTARATSVVRYLVDQNSVAPTRIGATGYGEERPAMANDTDAHRAMNRRVEVIVLTSGSTS